VGEAGGRIVAHFYDVESGAKRLDARGSGKGLAGFDTPTPRDGGLVDLIEETSSGGFDAVVCESINRLSRAMSRLGGSMTSRLPRGIDNFGPSSLFDAHLFRYRRGHSNCDRLIVTRTRRC
jgi:hypothetical protein